MLDNEVGFGGAKLIKRVVARENSAGMNPAVLSGLDVMLHVADEECLARKEIVVGEYLVNFFTFIPNARVRLIEVTTEPRGAFLHGEMIIGHCAEKEGAEFVIATELQEVLGMGQGDH